MQGANYTLHFAFWTLHFISGIRVFKGVETLSGGQFKSIGDRKTHRLSE
jgi:hypothetical protein